MSFFGEMFKKGIRKPLEYPNKTKKYLDEKALAERASRYEKNAIKNGEQFVSAPQFKKNARLEKNKKEVDAFNTRLNELTNEELENLDDMMYKARQDDAWLNEHKAEREAADRYVERERQRYQEYRDMLTEGMKNAQETENWDEYHRLREERNALAKKFRHIEINTPMNAVQDVNGYEIDFNNPFMGSNNEKQNYVQRRAHILNSRLPVVSPITDSNQKNITRYHTTEMKNLPGILKQGLLADKGGEGYGKVLLKRGASSDELGGVYTFARSPEYSSPSSRGDFSIGDFEATTYSPYNYNGLTLELTIPKKDYKKMSRLETNPEEYYTMGLGKDDGLPTIQDGGRTDIFENNVSPKYISGMWNSDLSKTKDWEDIIKNYSCDEDCDDWYNALTSNGFMDAEGEWNESLFNRLRGKLKGMQ